jgi:hypothetical protein
VVLVFLLRVLGAGFGWIVDLTVLGPQGRTLATLVWPVGSPPEQGHPNRSAVVGVPQEEPPPGTPHVRAGAQRRVSRRARPVNIPAEVPANGTHCERWSWRHGSDAVAIRFRASLAARNAPLRMGIRAAILRSSACADASHGRHPAAYDCQDLPPLKPT